VRVGRIELPSYRWQRYILPLNYTRKFQLLKIRYENHATTAQSIAYCRINSNLPYIEGYFAGVRGDSRGDSASPLASPVRLGLATASRFKGIRSLRLRYRFRISVILMQNARNMLNLFESLSQGKQLPCSRAQKQSKARFFGALGGIRTPNNGSEDRYDIHFTTRA
jgi:hypothetical protein